MIKSKTCHSVACDVCDYALDEDDDGIVVFATAVLALNYATDAGWWATEAGVMCEERDEEHWTRALEIRSALDPDDVSKFEEWLPEHWRSRLDPMPTRFTTAMPGQTEIPVAGAS